MKEERLKRLQEIVLQCRACPLIEGRPKMVFGDGSADALVVFIGESPGRTEAQQGLPFVGRSGKLLRAMIAAIGISPKDFYIANIIKDRPPNNRPPEKEEIQACVKFLKKQIEIIDPKFLVLLGKTAVKGLCPEFAALKVENLREYSKTIGFMSYAGIPAIVTYHPSALLRDPNKKCAASEDFKFIQNLYQKVRT
jgi:DNA polymerase